MTGKFGVYKRYAKRTGTEVGQTQPPALKAVARGINGPDAFEKGIVFD